MIEKTHKIPVDARLNLLHTASRLFAELGYEAVSTRLLAKEAGVNIAMIAYYFGSKEKLFEAIIEEHIPKTREILLHIQSTNLPHWEKFCLAIDAFVERLFDNAAFTRMIYRELSLQQRPAHNEVILRSIMRNWDAMQDLIKGGQDQGVFRKDVDRVMMMCTLFGTLLQMINTPLLACHIMQIDQEKSLFEPGIRLRVKNHLKGMIEPYLLVRPDSDHELTP